LIAITHAHMSNTHLVGAEQSEQRPARRLGARRRRAILAKHAAPPTARTNETRDRMTRRHIATHARLSPATVGRLLVEQELARARQIVLHAFVINDNPPFDHACSLSTTQQSITHLCRTASLDDGMCARRLSARRTARTRILVVVVALIISIVVVGTRSIDVGVRAAQRLDAEPRYAHSALQQHCVARAQTSICETDRPRTVPRSIVTLSRISVIVEPINTLKNLTQRYKSNAACDGAIDLDAPVLSALSVALAELGQRLHNVAHNIMR
jgi:hypothetical protein